MSLSLSFQLLSIQLRSSGLRRAVVAKPCMVEADQFYSFQQKSSFFCNLKSLFSCKKIKVLPRALLSKHQQIYILKSGWIGTFHWSSKVIGSEIWFPFHFLIQESWSPGFSQRLEPCLLFVFWVSSEILLGSGSHNLALRHALKHICCGIWGREESISPVCLTLCISVFVSLTHTLHMVGSSSSQDRRTEPQLTFQLSLLVDFLQLAETANSATAGCAESPGITQCWRREASKREYKPVFT